MREAKPFSISNITVTEAYKMIKSNMEFYGVDTQAMKAFEIRLNDNLYKIWNRMSSGSYFPDTVNTVSTSGISTVEDKIAQVVIRLYFEPCVESVFYENSYWKCPKEKAVKAVETIRENCWKKDWVLKFQIKSLFENIKQDFLLEMVKCHTDKKWIPLYLQRWMTVQTLEKKEIVLAENVKTKSVKTKNLEIHKNEIIRPLLGNLFLHYVFDDFMDKEYHSFFWERNLEEGIIHCASLEQAEDMLKVLKTRLDYYGQELDQKETKIIYCKDAYRKDNYENVSFDFMDFTFQPRRVKDRHGDYLTCFLPAISEKTKKSIREEVRGWKLQLKSSKDIVELSKMFNKRIKHWIDCYAYFYKPEAIDALRYINRCLVKWVRRKYKKCKKKKKAERWLREVANREPDLFAHWKFGI